jgi:hypothetical protein
MDRGGGLTRLYSLALAVMVLGTACPRDAGIRAPQKPQVPRLIAKFRWLDDLQAHGQLGHFLPLFPPIDNRRVFCPKTEEITVTEYPLGVGPSNVYLLRYQGCCETRCRRDAETREWKCGKKVFYIPCAKDLLVEVQDRRLAALAATSFQRYDPGGGRPISRVFLMDLDGDGIQEVVRWEELRQYQHTEWLIQAFKGTPQGLRRIADIRFHHTGPWQPNLGFPDRNRDKTREIEIAVQEFDDLQRRVVVRKRIYEYDRLLSKYVVSGTFTSPPPGLENKSR